MNDMEMIRSLPEEADVEAAGEEGTESAGLDEELRREAEALRCIYPTFDPEAELSDPVTGAFLRGEQKPTLRQLYEMVHMEGILEGRVADAVEERVSAAVDAAVSEAVASAVRACEERLLGHIRARGQRPAENGTSASAGIRMHPAADRLTRRERAMLAKRAENGEHIRL